MERDAVRNHDNSILNEIELEKRNFFNEIELKEIDLRNFLNGCSRFRSEIIDITTVEEMKYVIQEIDKYIFGNKPEFLDYLVTAIDKHTVTAC